MSNTPVEPLPLEPEEETIPEAPAEKDAYAAGLRQDLMEQTAEVKPPSGLARLMGGIRGLFSRKSESGSAEEAQDNQASSYSPEITSTPVLNMDELTSFREYVLDEEDAEEGPALSTGDSADILPLDSAFDLYTIDETAPFNPSAARESFIPEEEDQPEQSPSNFPFLDLSEEEDQPGVEQEAPDESQSTPFWQMYRIEGIEEEQEPKPPESQAPEPAPVTSEDEKEWKAFLSGLLRRQEEKPSSLEMDDSQLSSRMQSAGLYSPESDGMPRSKTGRLVEPASPADPTAPFAWEEESLPEDGDSEPPAAEEAKPPAFDEIMEDWFEKDSEEPPTPDEPAAPVVDEPARTPTGSLPFIGDNYYWGEETAAPDEKAEPQEDWLADPAEPTAETQEAPAKEPLPEPSPEESEASPERLRPIALEDYEPPPTPEPDEPSALDEVSEKVGGFWRSQNTLTRVAIILLSVFAFGLAVSIPLFNYLLNRPQPVMPAAEPAAVVDASGQPYPIGLKLTGGWFFNLQPSHIEEGVWKPEAAEWLTGTEVRKVVTIPWSRQSDAVVRSLMKGDMLQLHMSDNNIQEYEVDSVEQVNRSDISMYSNNEASLVVILYQIDSNDRWVVVSHLIEPKR